MKFFEKTYKKIDPFGPWTFSKEKEKKYRKAEALHFLKTSRAKGYESIEQRLQYALGSIEKPF